MAFTLSGLVTELEFVPSRKFADNTSEAHWRAYIAEGRATHRVRLSDDYLAKLGGTMPQVGDELHAEVSVSAFSSARGGASLSVVALAPLTPSLPALAAA